MRVIYKRSLFCLFIFFLVPSCSVRTKPDFENIDTLELLRNVQRGGNVIDVERFLIYYKSTLEIEWESLHSEKTENRLYVQSPCEIWSKLCHTEYIKLRIERYQQNLNGLKKIYDVDIDGEIEKRNSNPDDFDAFLLNHIKSYRQKTIQLSEHLQLLKKEVKNLRWKSTEQRWVLTGHLRRKNGEYRSVGYALDKSLINSDINQYSNQIYKYPQTKPQYRWNGPFFEINQNYGRTYTYGTLIKLLPQVKFSPLILEFDKSGWANLYWNIQELRTDLKELKIKDYPYQSSYSSTSEWWKDFQADTQNQLEKIIAYCHSSCYGKRTPTTSLGKFAPDAVKKLQQIRKDIKPESSPEGPLPALIILYASRESIDDKLIVKEYKLLPTENISMDSINLEFPGYLGKPSHSIKKAGRYFTLNVKSPSEDELNSIGLQLQFCKNKKCFETPFSRPFASDSIFAPINF